MATFQIIKNTEGYFTFVYDGDETKAVIDNAPNATSFGNIFHFKTKNGAPLFAQQNISFLDVIYTDIADVDFTFASAHALWVKLIDEEFFKGLNQGTGGGGSSTFQGLTDTFLFPGNDGKVGVVNAAENRLDPVVFYNFKDFIQLQDVAIATLIEGKILSVSLVGGIPKIVLSEAPTPTEQLANVVGYMHYADLATQTTPLNFTTGVYLKLTNDKLGSQTNIDNRPFGVTNVYDSDLNSFDFSQLSIGDTIDFRFDGEVTTTSANQVVRVEVRVAVGSPSAFTHTIFALQVKTVATNQRVVPYLLTINSQDLIDYPTEIWFISDGNGTIKINGYLTRIIRKGINIIDPITDNSKLDKQTATTEEKQFYVKNADGSQSMMNESDVLIENTDQLPEGVGNLYFTFARVLSTALTGISFVTGGAITATDTILQAFGKLQKQISDLASAFVPLSRTLTINGVTLDLSADRTFITEAEVLKWFSGDEYSVQATGSGLSLYGIATPATVGTASNISSNFAGSYTSAPLSTHVHRQSVSSAAAGNSAEFYESTHKLVANELGWVMHGKISFTWQSGMAVYTGLTGSIAATGNVNPSSLTDIIAFGCDDSDSQLQFIHNDSSGTASKVPMGSDFNLQSLNAYSFIMWNVYGGNTVNIQITNLRNNTVFSTSVNSDLPSVNTGLSPHIFTGNRAVAAAITNKFSYYSIKRQY